ncbi:hypothetical protein R1flu_027237 [Riccia fluitans]|uniref:FYVE-type domain-containing protein n=1 Tax=Riccia fluitans TaxID=41844 RepID=A0ABD1XI80_9MARC
MGKAPRTSTYWNTIAIWKSPEQNSALSDSSQLTKRVSRQSYSGLIRLRSSTARFSDICRRLLTERTGDTANSSVTIRVVSLELHRSRTGKEQNIEIPLVARRLCETQIWPYQENHRVSLVSSRHRESEIAMEEPPPFQEADQCVSCHSSFTTFKRRHHCRSCGRSFCNEHSANQKALPQYGLYTPVRVCDDCFNPPKPPVSKASSSNAFENAEKKFRKLALDPGLDPLSSDGDSGQKSEANSFICTCGMPLCICEVPFAPEPVASAPTVPQPILSHKPAKKEEKLPSASPPSPFKPSAVASSRTNMPSLFFSSGQLMHGTCHPLSKSYDLSGEGLREAVKNGDVSAVKELLSKGVDVNYFDRQKMSLLHLAAVFNFTEITFMLMDAGANVHAKNAQGETPIDCAQPTLGHKIRQKIGAVEHINC